MKTKTNQFVAMALVLLLCALSDSHAQTSKTAVLFTHPGLQWLSWTPSERENFVYDYIQGYGHGTNEACLATDGLFEKDKPHLIGHDNVPSTFPSARCRASVSQYKNVRIDLSTGPDFSAYTDAITQFYTKYPDHRDTPFAQLMELLTGTETLTAESLYSKLGESSSPKP